MTIADDVYYEELGLDVVGEGNPCPDFVFVGAAFTDVAGDLLADLPQYQTGDLLLAGWRTIATGVPPTGWSSQHAAQTDASGVSGFHLSYRIADGTEGSTVILPAGSDGEVAVVACWRLSADISGATWLSEIAILGAPFYGGEFLSGEHIDSVASEPAAAWPNDATFAATTLIDPASGYLIHTLSVAFVADPLPLYHWNHENERAQGASEGWNVLVAEGLRDTTSGSPAPSIELEETHTGIYHGWLTFICAGALVVDCDITPGNLTNDAFVDAIDMPIQNPGPFEFFEFGDSGLPHTPTDGETLIGATKQSGEPNHNGNTGGHSIWFKFTPETSGDWYVEVDTDAGSRPSAAPLAALYTGAAVNALTEVTYDITSPTTDSFTQVNLCEEDLPEFFIYMEATLDAGTTYYLAVDGRDGEALEAINVVGVIQ